MSPQDKVERVLKEIHVAFSKSETYNGHPDKVIIDRKQFLNLLDRLNQGIYDMMDQYEQTRQSRSNAERAFRKKGDEIIEAANANAEDVYAASVIYTADMIGAIRELMDHTNDSMNDLFLQFRKDLREQKDKLQAHENELQGQMCIRDRGMPLLSGDCRLLLNNMFSPFFTRRDSKNASRRVRI